MKFTVVTPSFNQAQFLPKALASVQHQTHRDYEHLIFDSGSRDGSLAIAEAYCSHNDRALLFSGFDQSRTHAVNLGFAEARGEILCWLNSDDRYAAPDVLEKVARAFAENPAADIVYGRGTFVSPKGEAIKEAFVHREAADLRQAFSGSLGILQPSLFMRRSAFNAAGPFDQRMNYSFDYEYWARCAAFGLKFHFLDQTLSEATIHDDAKTIRARGTSLAEAATAGRRYYDFLAVDWVRRLVDQEQNGAEDGGASGETVPETAIAERFRAENADARSLGRYFNQDPAMNAATRKAFADWVAPTIRQAYVSAWDAKDFDMGVTLVASIHRHDPARPIFVCDLGMTAAQRAFVAQIRDVILLDRDFPQSSAAWRRNPENRVFKTLLFSALAERLAPGAALLWIDAGVSLRRRPDTIFDLIEADGSFFIDHDDNQSRPLFNAAFTSDAALKKGELAWAEMAGPHVTSRLYGLLVEGPGHGLFREAARLAQIEAVALGDEDHPAAEKKQALSKAEHASAAAGMAARKSPVDDLAELRRTFGYDGRRQDQTILSALVARHGFRISSARRYCPAGDASGEVSKEEGLEGASRRPGGFRRDDFTSGGTTFHHRGLVKDFSGLRFDFDRKQVCAILGNGPSLADVDFDDLKAADSVGMNVAYRYWREIDWYPAIYCCLDTVLGMSHKEAILDLVRHRRRYGVRQFLLRQNLCEWLAERGATDGVVSFDLIRQGFEELHPEPVTTGSHALAWTAAIGYDRFIVAGVDCNYVERVDGAQEKADRTLEIVQKGENPNYFFAGYQQVGDQFNIPNPSKDLHIRSWRNVGAQLKPEKIVINVSAVSKMDAFPKTPFDVAMKIVSVEGRFDRSALVAIYAASAPSRTEAAPPAREVETPKPSPQMSTPARSSLARAENARFALLRLASHLLLGKRTAEQATKEIDRLQGQIAADDPLLSHARRVLSFVKEAGS